MNGGSPRVAIALSGGGYRAAAFSTGALLYLIDSGMIDSTTAISSVSGGSITNAYFARNVLGIHRSCEESSAWKTSSHLMAFLARRDVISIRRMLTFATLLGSAVGLGLGLVLLAQDHGRLSSLLWGLLAAGIVIVACFLVLYLKLRRSLELAVEWLLSLPDMGPDHRSLRFADVIRSMIRFYRLVFTFRMREAVRSMQPRMTVMDDLDGSYCPIFCCTDLATGSHFYLSPDFAAGVAPDPDEAWASLNLSGSAPTLPLARAVAASAAFPFVFKPTVIDAEVLGLPARRGVIEDKIVLADGGLYDNFGVSVLNAWLTNEMDPAVLGDLGPPPTTLLIVDCGQPSYQRQRHRGLVRALVRSMDVIHQANNLSRRREIQRLLGTKVPNGSLVSIGDDPFKIADECEDERRRQEVLSWLSANKALRSLGRSDWKALAQQRSPGIQTNLRGLGALKVAQLVRHGYVAMMARTVTDLGWPAADPTLLPASIEDLCNGPFVGTFWNRLAWILRGETAARHPRDSAARREAEVQP